MTIRYLLLALSLFAVAISAVEPVTIRARLLQTADLPTKQDLGTYTEGLVIFRWRVEDVLQGDLNDEEILVSHFGVYDQLPQPIGEWDKGIVRTLELVPFDSVERIQVLYASDPFEDDFDTRRFHHAGQTLLRDVPDNKRFDYGHEQMGENISLAIALHEQLRLVAIGDSQVHNGFYAKISYPLENPIGPVAVNFAVPSSGLPWANTLIRDYLVHCPKLEYIVLGLNSRMFNADRVGEMDPTIRTEEVLGSTGYEHDRQAGEELFAPMPNFITADQVDEQLWTGVKFKRWDKSYGFGNRGSDGTTVEKARERLGRKYTKRDPKYADKSWPLSTDAQQVLEALVRLCAEHDIQVIGYTPPINPTVLEFEDVVDEDHTTVAGHKKLLAWWSQLDTKHANFRFVDLNQISKHDLPVNYFMDTDHLTSHGAALATARLENARRAGAAEELSVQLDGAVVSAEWDHEVRWIISDGTLSTGTSISHRLPAPGHYLVGARWQGDDGRSHYAVKEIEVGDAAAGELAEHLKRDIEAGDMEMKVNTRIAPDGSGRVLLDATESEVDEGPRFVTWTLADGSVHLGPAVEVDLGSGEHEIAVALFDRAGNRATDTVQVAVP